jgi:hypothetical protein
MCIGNDSAISRAQDGLRGQVCVCVGFYQSQTKNYDESFQFRYTYQDARLGPHVVAAFSIETASC